MTRRRYTPARHVLAALLPLVLGGCSCGGPPAAPGTSVPAPGAGGGRPAVASPAVPAGPTVTVRGRVTFKGTPPEPFKLDMSAEISCHAKHPAPVYAQKTVVGEGGAVAWAFVSIEGGAVVEPGDTSDQPLVLDQRGCMYSPHVFGVLVGQPIEIVNSDQVLHNVHALPRVNAGFNIAQPMAGMKSLKTFDQAERAVRIKCDVHPWMGATVFVMRHPRFAVTDARGRYEIKGVPPGRYELGVWHEAFGQKASVVDLPVGQTREVDVELTM